jgi:predicted alpha/beta superfamily hydrolase
MNAMMTARHRIALAALAAAVTAHPAAGSESQPLPIRVETITSAALREVRQIWVSLPDGYDESEKRYPVIYMMDGEINFNSGVIGGVRQAALLHLVPEFIIVGIRNTDRARDVFPEVVTHSDGTSSGGRANQFLDFIQDELIPRVSKAYRTTDYRVLYGTSNTGFTTVHALFRMPDVANAYVAASATLVVPSFLSQREALIRAFKGGQRELVLVMGEDDLPTVISSNGALKEAVAQVAPEGLSCRLKVIEGASHVPADALVQGLRMLSRLPRS